MQRSFIKLFSAAALIVFIIWLVNARDNQVKQPIEFNHKIHLQDLSLECSDCHKYYERLARAGIPNINECSSCHSEKNGDSSAEAKVVEYVQKEEAIPWKHVNNIPDHVYFSHARHVNIGKLECKLCHGAMEELEIPLKKPFIPLKMSWCMKCHEEHGISNDCLRCHI